MMIEVVYLHFTPVTVATMGQAGPQRRRAVVNTAAIAYVEPDALATGEHLTRVVFVNGREMTVVGDVRQFLAGS